MCSVKESEGDGYDCFTSQTTWTLTFVGFLRCRETKFLYFFNKKGKKIGYPLTTEGMDGFDGGESDSESRMKLSIEVY